MEMQLKTIESWVKSMKPGEVFTIKDLPSGISRGMGDVTLSRMARTGVIRRVARGVYDVPQWNQLLQKEVAVDVDKVAHAIARKFGWTIRPSDESAVNVMGLSTQLPASYIYITTGPSKKYVVDGCPVSFVHRCNREMILEFPAARDVVRALKGLGKAYATPEIVAQMARRYSDREWEAICEASKSVSEWILELLHVELKKRRGRNAK